MRAWLLLALAVPSLAIADFTGRVVKVKEATLSPSSRITSQLMSGSSQSTLQRASRHSGTAPRSVGRALRRKDRSSNRVT